MRDDITVDLEMHAASLIDPWKVVLLRHTAKLSQEELGRLVGYRTGAGIAISRWETYHTEIPRERLGKLAQALSHATGRAVDPLHLCSPIATYNANMERSVAWRKSRRPLAIFLAESARAGGDQ